MKYIVYDRATGDRVRPNPMSLGKAMALTEHLNSTAGYRQYAYRPIGIFDAEYDDGGWLSWFLIALMVGFLAFIILSIYGAL